MDEKVFDIMLCELLHTGKSKFTVGYAEAYSYDIHGNVKEVIQQLPALAGLQQDIKHLEYEYELISGNVLKVSYQPGKPDQFYHKYEYDADNRLHEVYTSDNGVLWDKDAKYFYYDHGPLARVEIGDQKVQGIDYAYTINGWIKGVNSDALTPDRDMGKDAAAVTDNLHAYIARDAFGYSLNYFTDDYKPISNPIQTDHPFAALTASAVKADAPDLYNGNISAMVTTFTNPTDNTTMAQAQAFKYDQLNRLVRMRAHRNLDYTNNLWPAASGNDGSYAEDYTYNANGGITSLKRNGLASISSGDMDDLTYNYYSGTNKLSHMQDAVASTTYTDDMDNQNTNNYAYDEIGNLIKDDFECIQNIEWTVYGKVKKVTRTPGCTTEGTAMPDLEFKYNTSGNLTAKIVKPAATVNDPATWITTHYVHDASGNIMSTYEQTTDEQTQEVSFKLTGREIYGSSHIGSDKTEVELTEAPPQGNIFTRTLGNKQYFLSDHRQNNYVTISDRKIAVEDTQNPGTIAYYEADIVRAVDYAPFGRELNGRIWNKDESEFGYNGKQNIKEWSARLGAPQNYGFRIKYQEFFISVDPISPLYPWLSPYQFAGNTPIQAIDLEGLEPKSVVHFNSRTQKGQFTEPAIHLLYLTTGVEKSLLRTAVIQPRAPGQYRPWYSADDGGGAMTIGTGDYNTITYTENYFANDKNSYEGHGYGRDIAEWLDLSSHEVGHLPQIIEEGGLVPYSVEFLKQYAQAGNHDGAPYEEDADVGQDVYRDFVNYTNKKYGDDAVERLFMRDITDDQKIQKLDIWFNSFLNSKTGGNTGDSKGSSGNGTSSGGAKSGSGEYGKPRID